ncbi:thioredoxin domain-containing protein [bacterium]|nr:thioredoxin domain-containing protein [bacterium]
MMDLIARLSRFALPVVAAASLVACAAPSEVPSGAGAGAAAKDATAHGAPAAAPVAAPAAGAPDKAKLAAQVKRYFEGQGQLPADVKLDVGDLAPSQVPGLYEVQLKLSRGEQSQDIDFLVSADGRWFMKAEPIDLSVDPVDAVLGKIKVTDEDPSRGPKDAKVTIVEYSDFQCPFCAKANTIVEEEVLKQYGDKVRFVYKQYPLIQIHPWAEAASLVGLCVNKIAGSDAYWKYHSAVFAKAEGIEADGANDKLLALAKEAGADQAKVKDCLEKGETKAAVAASMAEAESIGVNSTPTFFVNGRRLAGAMPLDAFKAIIEPELQKGS